MLSLLSHVPSQVSWALNALTLASFHNQPPFQLANLPELLPALLDIVLHGLQPGPDPVHVDMGRGDGQQEARRAGLQPPQPGALRVSVRLVCNG